VRPCASMCMRSMCQSHNQGSLILREVSTPITMTLFMQLCTPAGTLIKKTTLLDPHSNFISQETSNSVVPRRSF
jgi:hypothetical protein